MPQYVLKVLVDFEARDDIEARKQAAALVQEKVGGIAGVREIVLQSPSEHKSIRVNTDGSFHAQWNKGGPSTTSTPSR